MRIFTHVCTDGTYKCIFQGYPVLIYGTTDKAKAFHSFGLSLVNRERSEEYAFIHEAIRIWVQSVYSRNFDPRIHVADGAQEEIKLRTKLSRDKVENKIAKR